MCELKEAVGAIIDRVHSINFHHLDAELVILPIDDPELYNENKKTADSLLKKGEKVIIVEFERPREISPKIELLTA